MTKTLDDSLLTVGDWVRWGASECARSELFFGHGTDNPWDEACLLVAGALKLRWQDVSPSWNCRLLAEEKAAIASLIEQRINQRMPAAYLLGEAWFAGHSFRVTTDVLIPRSPIAELIAHEFQPWLATEPHRILDLCTGSGCIGIVCAKQFDQAELVLSDISQPALAVASENIQRHHLAHRVKAVYADVFDGLVEEREQHGVFDLIVSNPPYVDKGDLASMPDEYQHEPRLALAAGDDGLAIVRRILADAADFLSPTGLLVVEVGNSWPALEQAYPTLNFIWPHFEQGGHGVFILQAEELKKV